MPFSNKHSKKQNKNYFSLQMNFFSGIVCILIRETQGAMKLIILLGMMSICSGAPQFLISLPQQSYHGDDGGLAHPAVLETAAREARYPDQQRNNFYKNPFISAGLARESLPTNKEMIVNKNFSSFYDFCYFLFF